MRISAGVFSGRWRQTTVGLTIIFRYFGRYFFGTLRDKASIIMTISNPLPAGN